MIHIIVSHSIKPPYKVRKVTVHKDDKVFTYTGKKCSVITKGLSKFPEKIASWLKYLK